MSHEDYCTTSVKATKGSSDGGNPTETESGVLVGDVSLSVAGAVYRGDEAHVFMDGQVTIFCGTQGIFSAAVDPPQRVGQTVVSEYTATFVGELVLEPPAVSSPATHSLSVQARMAESITLAQITIDLEAYEALRRRNRRG